MDSSRIDTILSKLPEPDENGMLSQIDKDAVEGAVHELLESGPDAIVALIDRLVEPGKGDDMKPRYTLHCAAVEVCKDPDRRWRGRLARVLTRQLDSSRPTAVKAFLIRELQVCAGTRSVQALGRFLTDPDLCDEAAAALVAIGAGAVEQLRQALPQARGRCRLVIIQSLGVLRDRPSAPALRQAASDADRDTRLAALWALANIGDAESVDVLLKAAEAKPGYERIAATKACLLLAEGLVASGKKDTAGNVYKHLSKTRTDSYEAYVHDAAQAALKTM